MKAPIIIFITVALLGAAARAQVQVEHVISPGTPYPNGCGQAMVTLGDIDGDGIRDYAVGCPEELFTLGRVRAYSGATHVEIWQRQGSGSARFFGWSLCCIDDITGDGIPEVGVGAPRSDSNGTDNGEAFVLNGATGAVMHTFTGIFAGDEMGASVAAFTRPDTGLTYLACGMPGRNGGNGGFRVYAAASGAPLMDYGYMTPGEGGRVMANLGDMNGDGAPDLAIGRPTANNNNGGWGEVRIYTMNSFTSINIIANLDGGAAFSNYGASVAACGDVDGDGLDDVLIGGPEHDEGGVDTGIVQVRCGPIGAVLHTHYGAPQSRLGQSVCGLGDLDGDGHCDYAAGAPQDNFNFEDRGCVMLWSGFDAGLIGEIQGPAGMIGYGNTVAMGADFDLDGLPELFAGDFDESVAHVIGLDATYLGSQEDLCLKSGIDDRATSWPDVKDVAPVLPMGVLNLELSSPSGLYAYTPPALIAWLKPTGAPGALLPGFPEVHIDAGNLLFLVEPYSFAPLAPALLPLEGLALSGTLPTGLAGTSLVVQGFALAPSAQQANPLFTATNAHEIRFQ